ncbi:LytR family transcriptional regulator [Bailinhaonella thermotolerans]|uniref:LytR family transcriptional regulator n=1 Tax=Bailinhaonella thermotolerans TaxID=1070861 RepID=A0A3A4ANL2_9ACTN|nr:LytR family transcriptional regulator [Bailinhaonella thermotolerans]
MSIAMACVMVIASLGLYLTYRQIASARKTEDFTQGLGNRPPKLVTGALNVLMVGSDQRNGANAKYGRFEGERTDTMMLMHISPKRDKALLVSFPRDSMVQMPECDAPNGGKIPPRLAMLNEAFNVGGIKCLTKTLEQLTKIRIDHFVKVDFTGFKRIVDALGGVEVCLPKPIDSKKAKIKLAAGRHNLTGEQALGYVRVRDIGVAKDDLSRIKRQQIFLAQVVKKATSGDLLTNPGRLTKFLSATMGSITTDQDLDVQTLTEIAQSARGMSAGKMQFVTVPSGAWPQDPNRVAWREPAASELFRAIASDVEVPEAAPSASAGAKPAVVVKPGQVRVQVLNGTLKPGLAKEAAELLKGHGFKIAGTGNAPRADGTARPKTMVLFSKAGGEDYAKPVAGRLLSPVTPEKAKVKPQRLDPNSGAPAAGAQADAGGPIIQLVIGDDWRGVKANVKLPANVGAFNGNTNPCRLE